MIPDITTEEVTREMLDAESEAARARVTGADQDIVMAALQLFKANFFCTCGTHRDCDEQESAEDTCANLYACALLLQKRALEVC